MKRRKLLLVLFTLILCSLSENLLSQCSYPDEQLPGEAPEKFSVPFISQPNTGEYSISVNHSGELILFSRFNMQNGSNTTWMTTCDGGEWVTPFIPSFARGTYSVEAFFAPTSNLVIFISDRDHLPNSPDFSPQIYVTEYVDGIWTTPEPVSGPFSNQKKMGASLASNGNLYFSQQDVDDVTFHIYCSEFTEGAYQLPYRISGWVNDFPQSGHVYVAPDESYMLFDAATNYPANWNTYIFLSSRDEDGTWSRPLKLNNTINSGEVNYMPYVSPDQQYMFFCRQGDLYWLDAKGIIGTSHAQLETTTGLENGTRIYPNPVSDHMTIEWSDNLQGELTILVLDMLGHVCYQDQTPSSNMVYDRKINLSFLRPGEYILNISDNATERKTERFIKN